MAKLTTSTDIGNFLAAADSAAGRDALGLPFATQQEAEAGTETNPRSFSPERIAQAIAALGGGGGVDGSAIILATSDDDLSVKYAEAKALTPNGNALSATNRAALVLMPGVYTLSAELAVDTNFVDVIGLGAGEFTPAVEFAGDTINVTASDVRVVGISVGTQEFKVSGDSSQIFEICTGGDNSFGIGGTVSGAFTNCTGGDNSFGNNGTASGTFTNCTAKGSSFGGGFGGIASGKFTNCTGGDNSFGTGGTASGTFTNCTGGVFCFGGNGTASGTFTNCTGGQLSFGTFGILSGKLYYCRLTVGAFETVSSGGITRLCIDGNNLENNQG